MKCRMPDYCKEFRCLAGSCPDTCCGQWEIVIDEDAKKRYLAMDGTLGARLRQFLRTEDGETLLTLENGRCPMLTEDGLCRIICETAEDLLCTTCREHPRFREIYGGLEETAFSLSCPEAARLLLEHSAPISFVTETDDRLPEPTDLDPDLFTVLLHCRETAFMLVQDRSRPLSDRLALVLCFAARLDAVIDRPALCGKLSDRYRIPTYQDRQLCRIRRLRKNGTMTLPRQLLRSMEHLTEDFPRLLPELEKTDPAQNAPALEHLTVYFLFRWWLKAACDGCLWRQAAAAVVSVLCIDALSHVAKDLPLAARLYSKEVEHSEGNLALLRAAMDLPQFSLAQLLKLLEVPHAI